MTDTPDQPIDPTIPPAAEPAAQPVPAPVAPAQPSVPVPPPPAGSMPPPPATGAAPASYAATSQYAPVPPPPGAAPGGPSLAQTPAVWFATLQGVYSREPERAAEEVLQSERRTTNAHAVWLFAALANGVLASIMLVITLAKLSSAFGSFSPVGVGDYIGAILLPSILTVASLAARATTLMGVGAAGKESVSFTAAAGLVSLSYIAIVPALAIAMLLSFTAGVFTSVLVLLALTFATLVGEITLYTQFTRRYGFEKSPLVPYAALTTVWVALSWLVSYLVLADVFTSRALGGGLF